MTESGLIIESTAGHGNSVPIEGDAVNGLEPRVRRLEDAVAALQDTRQLEERVAERVANRMDHQAAPRQSADVLFQAGRQLLPAALALTHDAGGNSAPRTGWLPWELYAEIRTIVTMFLDRRFSVSWTARVVPIVLLVFLVLSWLFLDGHFLLLGTLLDKVVDVLLIICTYKILSREAQRYREALPHLPPRP
jgi:hypothetical protein